MYKGKRPSQRIGVSGQHPPFPRRAGIWMALGLTALSPGAALAAFPPNINLGALNGTNGFSLSGVAAGDYSGSAVSTAGDVNGDRIDDFLIGAPLADPNGFSSGTSYVVFGGAGVVSGGNLDLSALNGTNGFKLSGVAARDYSGVAVSTAGDVNGDRIDDLLIGASVAGPNGFASGASYVVFGGAAVGAGGKLELSALDGTNGFRLSGVTAGDRSGYAVSTAGDVNGDGVNDILIGAPGVFFIGSTGASYLVFGGVGVGSGGNLDLSALDGTNGFKLSGVALGDSSGGAVRAAGDVNGDGLDDLLIGAPGADPNGASYVVFGGAGVGTGGNLELSVLDGTNGFRLSGGSGRAVSTAGDFNGDGVDDLLLGAPGASPSGSGASYVVFGGTEVGTGGNLDLSALDGTNGFRLSGVRAGDYSGSAVSTAGDVNGDGMDDVLIGAFGADPNGERSGASYVVFGQPTPPVTPVTCDGFPATLVGTFGNDVLFGTPGNDVIHGRGGNDIIRGLGGRDLICGGAGNDQLFGNQGKDQLFGQSGNDVLKGGTDNDRLFGQEGNDTMDGGLGNDDNCNGGSGTDTATSCEQPRDVP